MNTCTRWDDFAVIVNLKIADKTRRGLASAYHLGCWTTRGGKYYFCPLPTLDSSGTIAFQLMKLASVIAHKAGKAVRKLSPVVASDLSTIPQEYRPFDLWPLMVANFLSPQTAHRDFEDYHAGYCCLVPLGDYTGGEIHFSELQLTIPCQPGDVILFRSDLLLHQVLPYRGLRMSLIFTAHGRFMKWVGKKPFLNTQAEQNDAQIIANITSWREDLNNKKVSPSNGIMKITTKDSEQQIPIVFPVYNQQNPPPPPLSPPPQRTISQATMDIYNERVQIVRKRCE